MLSNDNSAGEPISVSAKEPLDLIREEEQRRESGSENGNRCSEESITNFKGLEVARREEKNELSTTR